MGVIKTGIVVLTFIFIHICDVIKAYGPALQTVIASSETAGHITPTQAAQLRGFLDNAQAICNTLRAISGY